MYSIRLKNMGTEYKWKYMTWATTDIHSCNSTAGKLEKEKHPSRPSNTRYRTDCVCYKQVPGLSSYSGNRIFLKKHHIPMLLMNIWNEPETCRYEWSQVDTRKEKKKFKI